MTFIPMIIAHASIKLFRDWWRTGNRQLGKLAWELYYLYKWLKWKEMQDAWAEVIPDLGPNTGPFRQSLNDDVLLDMIGKHALEPTSKTNLPIEKLVGGDPLQDRKARFEAAYGMAKEMKTFAASLEKEAALLKKMG